MSSWLLLRAMIAKELRMFSRERNQLFGLVIPIAMFAIAICAVGHTMRGAEGDIVKALAAGGQGWSPQILMGLRWGGIGLGAAISMFLALGYLVPTILGSFAGEKENRTLEVVLASPVPDTRLFLLKCLSVMLPMVAMGYAFLLIVAGLVAFWFHALLGELPVSLIGYALLAGAPVMLLIAAVFTALGAAISVRADSLKGAGHMLGGVVMLFFFVLPYGIPLVARYAPARRLLMGWWQTCAGLPFLVQYVLVLALLAIPAILLLALGRALFRRDRMLT